MSKSVRRHAMMAVMLGTALSTLAPSASAAVVQENVAVRDLSRYCVACWRNAGVPVDRWSDCTQEVLCELLERVPLEEWGAVLSGPDESKRELIRVVDLVKKRVQREKKWAPLDVEQAPAGASDTGEIRHEREAVRSASQSLLTARQRLILERSAEGFAIREIASELKMPTSRVSDEKYKAIRKLHDHFVQGSMS
jgi:DNA-binding CsgD family transcriptional regulator